MVEFCSCCPPRTQGLKAVASGKGERKKLTEWGSTCANWTLQICIYILHVGAGRSFCPLELLNSMWILRIY